MSGPGTKPTVLVLGGGTSAEADISAHGAAAIADALIQGGLKVIKADPADDLEPILEKEHPSVAFPVLHGPGGEDGTIQRWLEDHHLLYVGSGVQASQRASNKLSTKKIAAAHGIKVLPSYMCSKTDTTPPVLPCIIKPLEQGSSIGISIVKTADEWQHALLEALTYSDPVLVEPYIKGTELSVGIVAMPQPKALPVAHIIPPGEFFDSSVKYDGSTIEEIPAQISPKLATEVQEATLKLFKALELRDLCRADYIVDSPGQAYLLEVNTIPGLTNESILPKMLRADGISLIKFAQQMINNALNRGKV